MASSALAAMLILAGPRADDWVCVATEDGRNWECGQGADAPREIRPVRLPAPRPQPIPIPLAEQQPRQAAASTESRLSELAPLPGATQGGPMIFAPTDAPSGPDHASGPTIAGGYTLQIASMSNVDAVYRFAESFDMDSGDTRRGVITADGETRHLLVYGRFDSPDQAVDAIATLPAVLRSLGPRVVALSTLTEAPVPLATTATAAQPAVARAAPVDETISGSLAAKEDPVATRAADSEPSSPSAPASNPVTVATQPAGASDPATVADPPGSALAGEPPGEQEALPVESTAVAAAPPRASRERSRPAPSAQPPAASRQPIRPRERRWQTADAFADTAGTYTIQLANLPDAAAADVFVDRHGLDGGSLYGLPAPGGRTLLVFGRFDSLAAAQRGLEDLPSSLRGPWVRRAAPLLQN